MIGFSGESPQLCVEFHIISQMIVLGDENLLKIILENQMNNALKFTNRCEKAVIQVGSIDGSTERVYFVWDNEVWFMYDL